MDEKFEVRKYKCSICGKTSRKVMLKTAPQGDYPTEHFYYLPSTRDLICKACESEYHVINNYSYRGYGYKYSSDPKFTNMDKRTTPTFGVEIEVAGNVKNIEKIKLLTEKTRECSIGYDTSVEGAMFEFSYAPGTYFWYAHESHLKNVCKLLNCDPWVKQSSTIGNHIHIGNINTNKFYAELITAANVDKLFWKIMRIIAEREFNQYCICDFSLGNHHDAISYNTRWRTIEFRMFAGTYSAEKILSRIKFIRQIFNNITEEEGIKWHNFSNESKAWFFELMKKSRKYNKEEKEEIEKAFTEETQKELAAIQHDQNCNIRNQMLNSSRFRWFGFDEEGEPIDEYEPDYADNDDEEENY
jgi:hypothetical protein